ncbi:MAG: ROK family protein [Patescibacteria group bacterium]|jgi:glucokinase
MAQKHYVIGVDVGGTKIAAGVVSPTGKILYSVRVATEQRRSAKRVRDNIFEAIASCVEEYKPSAIGIGITGPVNASQGVSLFSPNLPGDWKNIPLGTLIHKRFHVPTFIDNDANAIGLAEMLWGKARHMPSALMITLGTGIGGVYLLNDCIVHGKTGGGSELGHITISQQKIRCSCGQYGHFESFVSGPALIRYYQQRTGKKGTTYDIVAEARRGKRDARAAIEEMRTYLGIGLASLMHAFSPHIIVLGGGLANIPFLTRDLQGLVRPHLMSSIAFGKIKIVKSSIQHTAGILGGAALTMNTKTP